MRPILMVRMVLAEGLEVAEDLAGAEALGEEDGDKLSVETMGAILE